MPKVTINEFKGFSRAKNLIDTPIDFLVEMTDCYIYNGRIRKRNKLSSYSNTDTDPIINFNEYFANTVPRRYCFYRTDTKLKSINGVTLSGTKVDEATGLPSVQSGKRPKFKFGNTNILYMSCSTDVVRKIFYDGSIKTSQIGIPVYGLAPTLSNPGVGSLAAGTYEYLFTWVEENSLQIVEGNSSPSGSIVIGVNQTIRIQIPISPEARINKAYIYRKATTGGETVFSYLDEVSVSTGAPTNYDDDGSVAINNLRLSPTDENTQLTSLCQTLEWHRQRMFYGVNTTADASIQWSEVNRPEAVKSISKIIVGDARDEIVDLITQESYLVIIKQRSIWILEGTNPDDFRLQQVSTWGCPYIFDFQIFGGTMFWRDENSIWMSDNFTDRINLGLQVAELLRDQTTAMSNPGWIIKDPKDSYIWFYIPFSGANNVLVYDTGKGVFIGNFAITANCFNCLETYTEQDRICFPVGANNVFTAYDTLNTSITTESNISSISFTTGAYIEEMSAQNKLYRLIQLLSRMTSTQSETLSLRIVRPNQQEVLITSSFVIDASGKTKKGLGRQDTQLGFKFTGSNVSVASNKQWAIAGMEIEYERIGNW